MHIKKKRITGTMSNCGKIRAVCVYFILKFSPSLARRAATVFQQTDRSEVIRFIQQQVDRYPRGLELLQTISSTGLVRGNDFCVTRFIKAASSLPPE